MRKIYIPSLLCLAATLMVIIISGCTAIETGRRIVPVSLQITDQLELPFKVEKALLDSRSGTCYIWEKDSPAIHLYRDKLQMNTIGGFGSEHSNFQKLSDITLDNDGNLLALDEFAGVIKKFTPDGKWIADIQLTGMRQPQRLCSTPEGDLIIYDSGVQELKRISGFDGSSVYVFGRFQVEDVSHISANVDVIAIVTAAADKTYLFTSMGMYQKDEPSQLVVDAYRNRYVYTDGALRLQGQDTLLPIGWQDSEARLFNSTDTLLLVKDNLVVTVKPIYQNR
jgi:hypothetical protein